MTPNSLVSPARLAGRSLLGTQTDERLVDLVRAGNETAFEVIVNRYRRALVRYVARLLPDGRAEDVVQQTFVNAYRAMQSHDAELRLRPWLYRIAHNLALNVLRDRGRMVEELHENIDAVEPPDHALERQQGLREVLAAVKSLPERQRSALVLREMEGRSYDEIAAELGASSGAVRQLLSRARDGVRAAATAVTPPALLGRIPWAAQSEPLAARVAELCGAGAAGAAAAKLCAGALVTGAVVTGVVASPNDLPRPEREVSARPGAVAPATNGPGDTSGGDGPTRSVSNLGEDGSIAGEARGEDEDDSSGPGSGDDRRDSSGSGSSGSGDSGSGSGSSGSGSSGSDNSGPGSGSSGSESSGSGHSGSGSGSSGSGSDSSGSGPGSGTSGSGSGSSGSGSGSSGSGSSGSGAGSSDPSGSDSGSSGSGSSGSGSGSSGSGPGSLETSRAPLDSSGSGSSGSGSEGDELEPSGGVSGSSG